MRKLIVSLTLVGLAAGLLAGPASAKKAVKVHETFGATLAPFPKDTRWEVLGPMKPGCTAGQEDVNWVAVPFTAPGNGSLHFYMESFTGDHDIYIFAEDGTTILMRGDQDQTLGGAPTGEDVTFAMKKGQSVVLAACNWLGQAEVLAHYEGTFK